MSIFFTSSNKNLILNQKKNFFLGSWCLKKNNFFIKKKNIIYQKKIRLKKLRNQFYLENRVYEKILIDLSIILNSIHKKSLSIRSWRIIIGPWLRRFISIIYDRAETIDFFIRKYKYINYKFNDINIKNCISFDTDQFTKNANSDEWNNYIFLRILSLKLNLKNLSFKIKQTETNNQINNNFLKNLLSKLVVGIFSTKRNIILFNTYLNRISQLKLIYQLRKIPLFLNFSSKIYKNKISKIKRKKINLLNGVKKFDQNEYLIRTLIQENIPNIFVESFFELVKAAKKINLLTSINTIFCCNGLYKNEIFKYWTALALENGSNLVCGQHGGVYGVSNFSGGELHEKKICNKFLSWGWREVQDKKVVPYSSFKILNEKINRDVSSDKILIVLNANGRYLVVNESERSDSSTAMIYTNFIIKFLKKIPKHLRENIYIKTHPSDNIKLRPLKPIVLEKFKNDYKFIDENTKLSSIIDEFKLIILTNNNTTFLEMIGLNKPCVLLANKKITFIRPKVIKDFINLSKVKIYHNSINECVKHILKINENINKWWKNKDTNIIKKKFARKFANNQDENLKKLSLILKNV